MKKIHFILLLCVSFLSAEINEYISDVYFANGIDTKKEDADKSIKIISKKFKLSYPEAYKSIKNWKVSYNTTHGIGIDLYESMLQKIYEDTTPRKRGDKAMSRKMTKYSTQLKTR